MIWYQNNQIKEIVPMRLSYSAYNPPLCTPKMETPVLLQGVSALA